MTKRTDELHRIAVAASGKGEAEIWTCCFALAELVGLYEPGQIKQLEKDLNLSNTQVYRRAKAGQEWKDLSSLEGKLPELRFSFYARMGELRLKWEFSPAYALAMLVTIKETGVTVVRMTELVEDEMRPTIAGLEGQVREALRELRAAQKNGCRHIEVLRAIRILGE
jgi:hypothetical protein